MASLFTSIFTSIATPLTTVASMRRPAFAIASSIPSLMSVRFMSKLKTHSGAKKRFMPISNGNFKRWQVGKRHLNITFSHERIHRLGNSVLATKTQRRMLRRAMPYA
ncbi:hypothetical protein BC936DRAFT_138837 [Jimgerdemannia flammicorona]|uniref:50S ribosomal protein L35 n=1 Tax=Jimgerdemannia flammicorona TaxID=994334 RepID=A0A433BGL3_9FUNG|nr:hypothetical protein BC936DRAFT_138837 [Jimgerdemannia flammicorona]